VHRSRAFWNHTAASTKAARKRRWRIRAVEDDDQDYEVIALCGAETEADNQETPAK
jgi:hypothetical protein